MILNCCLLSTQHDKQAVETVAKFFELCFASGFHPFKGNSEKKKKKNTICYSELKIMYCDHQISQYHFYIKSGCTLTSESFCLSLPSLAGVTVIDHVVGIEM